MDSSTKPANRLELLDDSDSDASFLTTSSTSFSHPAMVSVTSPRDPLPPAEGIQLLKATRRTGEGHRYPFARDVLIGGWKVVGGEKWADAAKVGAYVVYDVQIVTCEGTLISILRRYTEFERLRHDLKVAHPHLRNTIPKLPGKLHISKFSPSFLAERIPRLQRFLKTVMLHPEMGAGPVIASWVIGDEGGNGR